MLPWDGPFALTVPARIDQVALVRHEVDRWLREGGTRPRQCEDISLVASEAVANAVRHAYRGAGEEGSVLVLLGTSRVAISLIVADSGRWRTPDGNGLGLVAIAGTAQWFCVDRDREGTVLTAAFPLR